MHIAVVGSGYVGLVTGACLADFGMDVTCVDKDARKIKMLEEGRIPIYEPGLDALVAKNEKAGRLHFTTELKGAIEKSLAIFIAVGTPPREDGSADLTYVVEVAEAIADHMNGYKVVVTKSTVPIGTGQLIEKVIKERNPRQPFSLVSNPEFLREGSAIGDFMRPDRVVIGTRDPQAIAIMKDIYAPLYLIETPFVITNVESSELIKYASNAFLATKITYINEVAELCELLGADVHHVAKGMGLDRRIGPKFLHPGPGYGGSCFPKDTLALIKTGQDEGSSLRIVETVVAVNDARKRAMARKIIVALGGSVRGKKIALLGLAFKPNTDDMRDAPSLAIVASLAGDGADVHAYDPESMEQARPLMPEVTFHDDAYSALEGADAVAIVTEWDAFRALDLDRVKSLLKQPVIVDLRNVYRPADVRKRGFTYVSIGRR